MFGALKRGFQSMASLILVRNVVGELQRKRTLAASRGFLATARLSCIAAEAAKSSSIHKTPTALFRTVVIQQLPRYLTHFNRKAIRSLVN